MEDNIPYGYDDQGQPLVGKFTGTSLGFRNYQTRRDNEAREKREWKESIKDLPATPQEANDWFAEQREKYAEENERQIRELLGE